MKLTIYIRGRRNVCSTMHHIASRQAELSTTQENFNNNQLINMNDGNYNNHNHRGSHQSYNGDDQGYYQGAGAPPTSYRHDSNGCNAGKEERKANKDPYAGLMTQREKDWLIKNQLMQLQMDNPYLEDYYYNTWQLRKKAEENKKNLQGYRDSNSEAELVLPDLSVREESQFRKLVQFPQTLGCISSVSVHRPRGLIDVARIKPAEKDETKQELRRSKDILLYIEETYDLLLKINDIEKLAMALPANKRSEYQQQRSDLINKIWLRLFQEANHFGKVMSVKKGVQLITRFLPHLPMVHVNNIVSEILLRLSLLYKKQWQGEAMLASLHTYLDQIINMAEMKMLVCFSDSLLLVNEQRSYSGDSIHLSSVLIEALQQPIGSSVVWALISRGEHVFTHQDLEEMDLKHQDAWRYFVVMVIKALQAVSKEKMALPIVGKISVIRGKFELISNHLQRYCSVAEFEAIKDKLNTLVPACLMNRCLSILFRNRDNISK